MSQRSIRRAQQRKLAAEQRRETLRRRRVAVATGAAIGASAFFAPSAMAAPFEVNSLGDGLPDACDSDCTLRDAITLANANSEADTITFKAGLSGTILLTQGELPLASSYGITINGPGRDVISISGDADNSGTGNTGDSRIFNISGAGAVAISGLTMTEGYSSAGDGGAVIATGAATTITDSAITNSAATGTNDGGGVEADAPMNLVRTEVSGNTAHQGAGLNASYNGPTGLSISQSKISDNHATSGGGGIAGSTLFTLTDTEVSGNDTSAGSGGGIFTAVAPLTIAGGSISGNSAPAGNGGAIALAGPYAPLDLSKAVISGNSAANGGAIDISPAKYPGTITRKITDTTISGNHATTGDGGGVRVATLARGDQLTISHSTISGNDAPAGVGGGIGIDGQASPIEGAIDLIDSTISGNTAATGGGVSVGKTGPDQFLCSCGSIAFDNSTIAANTATATGGGLYLAAYDDPNNSTVQISPTIPLTSTIVADNTLNGAANDLDRANTSTSGGFDLSFSLVENAGDAPVTKDAASFVGTDPQLGPLANNGGPTKTQLPAQASPVVDRGHSPARLTTDQRGLARIVDGDPANAPGGDGTDIGAVEIDNPPKNPPPTPQPPAPPPPVTPPKNVAPQAFIKKNRLGAKKTKDRRASGIAIDDSKVAKVQLALVFKSGGKCRDLLASGLFSRSHLCGRPRSFITAKGTTKWTFALPAPLATGYYVLYSRAIDDKGLKQTSFGTKSRRPFRVRGRGR